MEGKKFEIKNGKLVYLNSPLVEEEQSSSNSSSNNDKVVIAAGVTGKEKKPHELADTLIKALKKVIRKELEVEPKTLQDMFEKFNKAQKLDPFFDEKHYKKEMAVRDSIEEILDGLDVDKLKRVYKFCKREKGGE